MKNVDRTLISPFCSTEKQLYTRMDRLYRDSAMTLFPIGACTALRLMIINMLTYLHRVDKHVQKTRNGKCPVSVIYLYLYECVYLYEGFVLKTGILLLRIVRPQSVNTDNMNIVVTLNALKSKQERKQQHMHFHSHTKPCTK